MKLSPLAITAAASATASAASGINSLFDPAAKLIVTGALLTLAPRALAADAVAEGDLKGKLIENLLGVPQEGAAEFDFDPAAAAAKGQSSSIRGQGHNEVIVGDDVSPADLKVPEQPEASSSFIKKVRGGMSLRKTFLEVMEDADLSDAEPISLKGANDFTKVGQGFCKDNSNNLYSFSMSNYMPWADNCYYWCLQKPGNSFIGLSIKRFVSGAGFCHCLFSDEGASNISTNDYNPPAKIIHSSSKFNGSGALQRSSGSPSYVTCYSYNKYVPQTISPTRSPTASPSQSLIVFTEVGQGWCKDNKDNRYSCSVSKVMQNTDGCYNWCLQKPENSFIGLSIVRFASGAGFCYCFFPDGGASNITTNDYNPPARVINSSSKFNGSGALQASGSPPFVTCYSYDGYQPQHTLLVN